MDQSLQGTRDELTKYERNLRATMGKVWLPQLTHTIVANLQIVYSKSADGLFLPTAAGFEQMYTLI